MSFSLQSSPTSHLPGMRVPLTLLLHHPFVSIYYSTLSVQYFYVFLSLINKYYFKNVCVKFEGSFSLLPPGGHSVKI